MCAVAAGLGVLERRHLAVGVVRALDVVSSTDRVASARARIGDALRDKVLAAGAPWPPRELYLRATKHDIGSGKGHVEVWGGDGRERLRLIVRHPLCALSGVLGPKRREGDLQIPEGFYRVAALNPRSSFHLSLRIDYPNASDQIRNRRIDTKAPLGGDIMVHGSCVTIGCLPIDDDPIEEVYLLVNEVFPQATVPIHIFPRPLDDMGLAALLATSPAEEVRALWTELHAGWQAFETTRRVPAVRVAENGRYIVTRRG